MLVNSSRRVYILIFHLARGIDRFCTKVKARVSFENPQGLEKRGPCLFHCLEGYWEKADLQREVRLLYREPHKNGFNLRIPLNLFNQIEWFSAVRLFRLVFNEYIHFWKFRRLVSFQIRRKSVDRGETFISWIRNQNINIQMFLLKLIEFLYVQ